MITPQDITGVDDDLAREVLVLARSIAPCLDQLEDEPRRDAIAIIRRVARDAGARGSRHVKSQRIGPASVDYGVSASWFADDDRAALRSLCASTTRSGLPLGSFPVCSPLGRVWPEGDYS